MKKFTESLGKDNNSVFSWKVRQTAFCMLFSPDTRNGNITYSIPEINRDEREIFSYGNILFIENWREFKRAIITLVNPFDVD